MLKYKVTLHNMAANANVLDITDTQIVESVGYDVMDVDNLVLNEDNTKNKIIFTVKDIFNIQPGSHLLGVNRINLSNEDGTVINTYEYSEDLVADSASDVDNTFTVMVNKRLLLTMESIKVETIYHSIQFIDNKWVISRTNRDWLLKNGVDMDNNIVLTNMLCIGSDNATVPMNEELVNSNSVFYYENNCWKHIHMVDGEITKTIEGEKNEDLKSFHTYDTKDRYVHNLDNGKIYYTRETYVVCECNTTHFFSAPNKTYEVDEDEEVGIESIRTTKYGKNIVKSVDYPNLLFEHKRIDDEGFFFIEGININELHIDNDSTLSFNLDGIEEKETIIERLFPNGMEVNYIGEEEYDVPLQDGSNGAFNVSRENIMYNSEYTTFDIIFNTAVNTIQIPFGQKFETDMFHNDALKTHFVDTEMAKAINPIMDLEKDVYLPAICDVTKEGEDYKHINGKYRDCYGIIFNLHFREHRDDDGQQWKCEKESYWNGTRVLKYKDKKIIDLQGRVFQYKKNTEDIKNDTCVAKTNKRDYFSYFGATPTYGDNSANWDCDIDNLYGIDNDEIINFNKYKSKREYNPGRKDDKNLLKEYQSDTLGYLGFTNNDVKFQKSKLKKSFLRISFYDSDNIGNQNLLQTSTIFLDSGNLFAKYVKYIDDDNKYEVLEKFTDNPGLDKYGRQYGITYEQGEVIEGKIYKCLRSPNRQKCAIYGSPTATTGDFKTVGNNTTEYDKGGIRVNREPMRLSAINVDNGDLGDSILSLEELRLSSQFEVSDKFSSKRSSEGFYFYTYKNNDNGVFPSDIYMRVEFNHAGYGRTIPFMMPYIRQNEENGEHSIKRYRNRTKKIKTFDDICYDWSEIDYDNENGVEKDANDIGYGTIRYMKYSYIHWKYRYDKETQKHIYYLDPDIYGDSVTTKNGHGNNIILNLYEGKIR